MNCRPFAVALSAFAGLVPTMQNANAGVPTHRQATATATILQQVTNDPEVYARHDARRSGNEPRVPPVVRFLDRDGVVLKSAGPGVTRIFIIDLP